MLYSLELSSMSNNVSNSHLRTDSSQDALQSGIEQYVPQRKQQPPQNRQQPRRFTVWNWAVCPTTQVTATTERTATKTLYSLELSSMSHNISNSNLRTDSNQGALQSWLSSMSHNVSNSHLRADSSQNALQSGIEQYVQQRKQQPPQNGQQPRRFTIWNWAVYPAT